MIKIKKSFRKQIRKKTRLQKMLKSNTKNKNRKTWKQFEIIFIKYFLFHLQLNFNKNTKKNQDQNTLNGYTTEVGSLVSALKNKDKEIQEIQENMAQWKQETLGKLAEKFEIELNKELDRQMIFRLKFR